MSQSRITFALVVVLLLAGAVTSLAQESDLIAVIKSDAPLKEKMDACRQLARVGTKDAVPALAALLGDEELSHMARYALEPIDDPSVDEALREALGKLKGRPLVGVIGSLGVRRDAKAVEPLAKMLGHSDADAAATAARSLGKIATAEAADVLTASLPKAAPALRAAVADGCLGCAEAMLAQGKRTEAAAMYDLVGKADLPKHFRIAAVQGALLARQPAADR